MILGIRFAALSAAKPAKAVAVRPEFSALNVTRGAIHINTLQQAVAVCQYETGQVGYTVSESEGGRGTRTPIARHDLQFIRLPLAPARRPPKLPSGNRII